MHDGFHTYTGFLDTIGLSLLLLIIAAFYIGLTLEAFKGSSDDRAATGTQRKGGAGADCRPG